MKIGILTFHSQLNYGRVLQCWALQTGLEYDYFFKKCLTYLKIY